MKKRAADIIMETLVENGITDAFCVVGGGAMFLDNALVVNPDINVIFNHHEQACAMACEGYARTKDKMALCLVTSGPGGTNTLTGVMGAYQDSIPMIVISGQVRYATTIQESGLNIRRRGEQEFDIVNSVQNMTKYAKMITDPLAVKQEVQKAIDIALSGRRGPVWLDIPLDVQSAVIEEEDLLPLLEKPDLIKCFDEEFDELKELIKNAKSPCILAGTAVSSTHSQNKLKQVLTKWQIPTVSAAVACDILYHEHPLYFGSTGGIGTRSGNFVMQNADVLVVMGCSLGFKQTTFVQDAFAPNAKIIMIDVNPDEAKKSGLNIDKFIHSDISHIFNKIMKSEEIKAPLNWIEHCNMLKNKFNLYENANGKPDERVSAYNFWAEYAKKEANDSLTVMGNSSSVSARLQFENIKENQLTFTNINCGSMGYDIPAAIGAAKASNRDVVLVTGDGSFMMNLQELQTIKHNNLPIKIVLFSNDGYRGIVQTCKNYFNGKNVGCTTESGLSMPNFEKISYAFDIPYLKCKTNSELSKSIDWLLNQKGACILELLQVYENPPAPVVKPKLNTDGSPQKIRLEDMYPFLDKEDFSNCMFKGV